MALNADDPVSQDSGREAADRKTWSAPTVTEVPIADVTRAGGFGPFDGPDYDS